MIVNLAVFFAVARPMGTGLYWQSDGPVGGIDAILAFAISGIARGGRRSSGSKANVIVVILGMRRGGASRAGHTARMVSRACCQYGTADERVPAALIRRPMKIV